MVFRFCCAMDDTITAIISILTIFPDGLTMEQLETEYEELEGKRLHHGQFGFNSSMEFLQSIPSLKFYHKSGEFIIQVENDSKTEHITKLVQNQKYSTKKQPGRKTNHIQTESSSVRKVPEGKYVLKRDGHQSISDRKQLRCSSRSYDFITDDTTRNIKRLAIEENSEPSSLRVTIKRENEESRRQVSYTNGFEKTKLDCDGELMVDYYGNDDDDDDVVVDVNDHVAMNNNYEISNDAFKLNEKIGMSSCTPEEMLSKGYEISKNEKIRMSSCTTPEAMLSKGYEINQMLLRSSSVIGSDVLDETFESGNNDDSIKSTNFDIDLYSRLPSSDSHFRPHMSEYYSRPPSGDSYRPPLDGSYRPSSGNSYAIPSSSADPYSMAPYLYPTPPLRSAGLYYSSSVLSDDPRSYFVQTPQSAVPHRAVPSAHYSAPLIPAVANYSRPQRFFPHSTMTADLRSRVVPQESIEFHSRPQSVVPNAVPPTICRPITTMKSTIFPHVQFQTGDYSLSNCPTPAQGREIRDGEAACTYSGNQVRAQTVKKHAPEEIIVDRIIETGDYSLSNCPTPAQGREIRDGEAACTYSGNQVRAQTVKKHAPEEIIVDRIIEMARNFHDGIFVKNLKKTYTKRFGDTLPDDWLKFVEKCPNLIVKDSLDGQIISCSPNLSDTIESLPEIVLPADPDWEIYITRFSSVSNIYFRILGEQYNDTYDYLTTEMNEFYRHFQRVLLSADVKTGSYYVALCKGYCFRVQVQDVAIDGKIKCFLIDHGDVDSFTKLFPLMERFASLPPQAIWGSLTGVEEADCLIPNGILESLVDKAYVVRVDDQDRDNNLKLTVYDTSSNNQDVNINELLKSKISKNKLSASRHTTEDTTEVLLTSFRSAGKIYVQPITEKMTYLNKLIAEAANKLDSETYMYQLLSASEIVKDKLYLVNYRDNWHRAFVKKVVSKNEIIVRCVDFGCAVTISLDKIVSLDGLSEDLKTIPGQAIKVRLHNISEMEVDNAAVRRVKDIVDENETLIMKVIDKHHGLFPTVELFKKNHDFLQSINDYILKCNVSQS